MEREIYPLPVYYGIGDDGLDYYCVYFSLFDGFNYIVDSIEDDFLFCGSYDDCCHFIDIHS